MQAGEALRFSIQALRANPVRSLLTCLGMLIGNASVILVVTISLTGREFILGQVQAIGSNMIFAYYEAGSQEATRYDGDFIKIADVEAVRTQLGDRIVAATGVITNRDTILIGGRPRDVNIIGSDQHYKPVRNLLILAGRALDDSDVTMRSKVALLTEKLAVKMYGGQEASVGQVIKLFGLQFTVVGTFKERVESFGQSEVQSDSILVPMTVIRYFTPVERIDPMYVQVRAPLEVEAVTARVKEILEGRHRAGASYKVENLEAILDTAKSISQILTLVLLMVAAIALIISGIGIMNIMLVTVTERTREIGVRMAVGASRSEILTQFLAEATMISLAGGIAGILVGIAIPWSVQFFVENMKIPISTLSIVIAFGVSCVVGLAFGLLPANRASRLNPTEALRYE